MRNRIPGKIKAAATKTVGKTRRNILVYAGTPIAFNASSPRCVKSDTRWIAMVSGEQTEAYVEVLPNFDRTIVYSTDNGSPIIGHAYSVADGCRKVENVLMSFPD